MSHYDPSMDYGRYPTFAPLPEELLGQFARCETCGGVDFRFRLPDWTAVCKRCGEPLRSAPPVIQPQKHIGLPFQFATCGAADILLRNDGTLRFRGRNTHGQCNVNSWR